ncbi:MAG: hypothetical protein K6G71_06070 [Clostridiales bacterium]|nr:hypothetical protein [Clostridiales bacterium]
MTRIISFFTAVLMFLIPAVNIPKTALDTENANTQYTCVFVHGLSGWGEYDFYYRLAPYWGMFGGDLMRYLRARGVDAHAATVAPTASAWDRACELYAQLTGTRTDYGAEHSERCGHSRYGKDYSCVPLIKGWDAENKINLFGHSFGGATILLFAELMANGSDAEREATPADELSELFKGGKGDWIYSLTALSAPMNGTTAYNAQEDIEEDPDATVEERTDVALIYNATEYPSDRIKEDSAWYDLHIDGALELLEGIETQSGLYYFSIPCCKTVQADDGTWHAAKSGMEPLFRASAERMGSMTGVTPGGFVFDESWQQNDGLVNTISARAPLNAPQRELDRDDIQPGIWNVFPVYDGDHMSLQGGMLQNNPVRELYMDIINMINSI